MLIHPLLSEVPQGVRQQLMRFVELRHFRKNDVVLLTGQPAFSMYCVASGLLRVGLPTDATARAELITTNFLRVNDIYLSGPLAQADRPNISELTLVAALPSAVYVLPMDIVRGLCTQYPSISMALVDISLERANMLRRQLRRRSTLSAEKMVARVLHELTQLAPQGTRAFSKRISQALIASYTGLSRGVVNKVINDLEQRGQLRRSGDSIQLEESDEYDTLFGETQESLRKLYQQQQQQAGKEPGAAANYKKPKWA